MPAQNCHCWGAAGETIEDSQADYATAELARATGDSASYKAFLQRGENWQNVFNANQTSGTFKGYAWNKNGPIVCPPGDLGAHVAQVTATGENPPSEIATNLKDCNNGTKWLQFNQPSTTTPPTPGRSLNWQPSPGYRGPPSRGASSAHSARPRCSI